MKLFKNPIFWGVALFAGGILLGAIGWDKDESTIPERTVGSVPMMATGVAMIVVGLLIMFIAGNRK